MKSHRKIVACALVLALMLSACSTTSTTQITDTGDTVLKNTNFDSFENRKKKTWLLWSKRFIRSIIRVRLKKISMI